MPKLLRPTTGELEKFRSEATKDGSVSEDEWVRKCCSASARILRKDPLRYRSYGPYWWVQKRAMIAHDIDDFGDFVDAEWHEMVDYGNDFYNLLAALLYSNSAMDSGLIYSNAHNVAFVPDGEGAEHDINEYVLVDEDMEALANG